MPLLALLLLTSVPRPHITTGVWYEGGVGEFRQNLIPDDPKKAADLYLSNFRDVAAHGVEVVVAPNSPAEHHRAILDAAQRAHVKLILELGPEGGTLGSAVRSSGPIDAPSLVSFLDRRLKPIVHHPALLRVQVLDEPWCEVFGRYAQVADLVAKSKPPFCCVIESSNAEAFLDKTGSDVIAFDCYPLGVNIPVGDPAALNHFRDVAAEAARAASKHKAQAWAVVQCHAIKGGLRLPTPAEVRWMTHTALAEGCKGIFWFLYQTEWLDKEHKVSMNGLVDPQYRPRPLWDEVGRLTKRIHAMDRQLSALRPTDAPVEVKNLVTLYREADRRGGSYLYVINPSMTRSVRYDAGPGESLTLEPGDGRLIRVR